MLNTLKKISLFTLTCAALTSAAQADHHGAKPLTDAAGMSLYTFDKDADGVSNCYGDCAVNWPPFLAKTGAEIDGLGTVERNDGALQWAKDGAPLYYWIGDANPGDTSGDGVGGVWHLAK